ncbi:permease prefix domain 1-containing protein [Aminipila sp.]|uniref:permease prefix domain 1-containing protein n=1 Tax=Aminipila sp. TaxID=2060095 RepID=UPI0028A0017C|nr:permease prefix domain 1-containing protein [Aminipila sp.]
MPQCNEEQNFGKAGEYVKKVCEQIRWGRAHKVISQELLNHIEDQKEAYIKKGQKEQEAERNAVLEMGDAVTVGQQLDRTHRPKPEWGTIVMLCICLILGAVVQFIISYYSGMNGENYNSAFKDYLVSVPFGLAAFLFVYFTDFTLIIRSPIFFYFSILAASGGIIINSTARFGTYGHIICTAMLLCPMYAAIVYNYRNSGYGGIIKSGIIAVLTLGVFAYGGGYMACFLFALSGLIILSTAISKGWFSVKKWKAFLLVYVPALSVLMYTLLAIQAHISLRGRGIILPISSLIHQQESPDFYVIMVLKQYIQNLKLWGEGMPAFPNSLSPATIEKILPCWGSDYSLVYIAYKFGYVCAAILIAILAFLLIRMLVITLRQTSELGFIVCLSVTIELFIQSAFYISSNLGVMTAVAGPLPFITYEEKSFIVNMYLMGLFLSAFRNKSIVSDKQDIKSKKLWLGLILKKKKSTGGDNYAGI